jgi:hypothetical protein
LSGERHYTEGKGCTGSWFCRISGQSKRRISVPNIRCKLDIRYPTGFSTQHSSTRYRYLVKYE